MDGECGRSNKENLSHDNPQMCESEGSGPSVMNLK